MLAPRLAMLAMLSFPVMGYWAWFLDTAPLHLRQFRLLVTLAAMLVLGLFVFLRQLLMDRELVRLLDASRSSLENMKRLQTELVQREKLASLAQLVSGAAHEINNPLAAILGYSELLAAQARDSGKYQRTMPGRASASPAIIGNCPAWFATICCAALCKLRARL